MMRWQKTSTKMPKKNIPLMLLVKATEVGYNKRERVRVHRVCCGTWDGKLWHITWGFAADETVPEICRTGTPDATVDGWKYER